MHTKRFASIIVSAALLAMSCTTIVQAEEPPEAFQLVRSGPGLSLHKQMFMLPATISDEYTGAKTEAVFQISAKHRIFNAPVYFAYTQISFWQAYDHRHSAPFRETNYNPELFFRTGRLPFHSGQVGADLGFEHESNGQIPPVSRSWNLLYAAPYYFDSNLLLYVKLRYRIPEDAKKSPEDAVGDDNPDITDYLGYSDVQLFYRLPWNHMAHLMLRGNAGTGRGCVIADYSIPVPRSALSYFMIRFSYGYGESLVDYNRILTRIGFGIMFAR